MMAQKQRLHGFTTPQLAQLYGRTKKEIEDLMAMRALAAEYLKSRDKENAWSEVKGDKYAFQELLKATASTTMHGDKEIIKQASFALIDDSGEAGERLYSVIPKVKEYLAAVKENLAEAFPLTPSERDEGAEEAFGGGYSPPTPAALARPSELALVAEMRKDAASVKKAREVVIDTIRSQEEQNKERDAADFLFKTLKKANALILNASGHGLRPETSSVGVGAQLIAIRAGLDRIDAWLSSKDS